MNRQSCVFECFHVLDEAKFLGKIPVHLVGVLESDIDFGTCEWSFENTWENSTSGSVLLDFTNEAAKDLPRASSSSLQ